MSVENKQVRGDASVSRNVNAGGNARVQGNMHVGHNLRVDGTVEAQNIKAANKGLFLDEAQLKARYPHPEEGWFAGVGSSSPFVVYIARNGEWQRTNGTFSVDMDMDSYNQRIDDLESQVAELIEIILSGGGGNVVNIRVTAEGHGYVTGSGLYQIGNSVTLTATAESGYYFVEWQDAEGTQVSTDATYTFDATESVTLKAVFAVSYFTVTVGTDQGNLAENVTKTDPRDTTNGYVYKEEVTVTAAPKQMVATAYFVHWEDAQGVVKSTSASYTFNVTENVALKAIFAQIVEIDVEVGIGGSTTITVTRGGQAVDLATDGVRIGDIVKLTATGVTKKPSAWKDGQGNTIADGDVYAIATSADGKKMTCTFTYADGMSLSYIAEFNGEEIAERHTVAVEVEPPNKNAGSAVIQKDGTTIAEEKPIEIEDGTNIELVASVNPGWAFSGWWKGNEQKGNGQSLSYGMTVSETTAGTYTAKFERSGAPDFYYGIFDTPQNNPVLDNINDDAGLTKGWLTDNAKAQITLPKGKTFVVLWRSSVVPTACNITDDIGPGTLDLDSQQSFYATTKTLNNVAYAAREFYGGNTGSGNWSVEITFAANSNS